MFEVYVSKKALKGLKEMPREYQERVLRLLKRLEENPLPEEYGVKKLRGFESAFRIRIGKYRVIYKVDWKERRVFVDFIGHRSGAY